jgi:hypothetical protein
MSAADRFAIIPLQPHEPPPDRAIAHGGGPLIRADHCARS